MSQQRQTGAWILGGAALLAAVLGLGYAIGARRSATPAAPAPPGDTGTTLPPYRPTSDLAYTPPASTGGGQVYPPPAVSPPTISQPGAVGSPRRGIPAGANAIADVDAYLLWLGQFDAQRAAFNRQAAQYLQGAQRDYLRNMVRRPAMGLLDPGDGPSRGRRQRPVPSQPDTVLIQNIDKVTAKIREIASAAKQRTAPPPCQRLHTVYVSAIDAHASLLQRETGDLMTVLLSIENGNFEEPEIQQIVQRQKVERQQRQANNSQPLFRQANQELIGLRTSIPNLSGQASAFTLHEGY